MVPSEHIFYHHLLHSDVAVPLGRVTESNVWPSIYAVAGMFMIAYLSQRSLSHVMKIIRSVFGKQFLQRIEREEAEFFSLDSMVLTLFFIFNIAFLSYKLNSLHHLVLTEFSGWAQFTFFLGIILAFVLLKAVVNQVLYAVTGRPRVIAGYMVVSLYSMQAIGIVLFPVIILMQFSDLAPATFLSMALGLLGLYTITKWARGFILSVADRDIGILQILCYFCALEILPVLVIAKFTIETF